MTDTSPQNVISFRERHNKRPSLRVIDCQSELMDQLQQTYAGLTDGLTAAEIRDRKAKKVEALIENLASQLKLLRTPRQATMFMSRVAIKMNAETEL